MDLLGKALLDYYHGRRDTVLYSCNSLGMREEVPVSYFFRGFPQMPSLEKKALEWAEGPVLDIGCGAGSHCLWLQQKGLQVTGIDQSAGAVEVAGLRGVDNLRRATAEIFKVGKYRTLLLLMNGIGLAGTLRGLAPLLGHLSSLLQPGGQILLDSSDLSYLYEEDADGGLWVPGDRAYYGEMSYRWEYDGYKGSTFQWLFVDYATLEMAAARAGLKAERMAEGPHYDYLAKLTRDPLK